jgi:hypothetical protein
MICPVLLHMSNHLIDCLGNRRLKKSKKLGLSETAGRAELSISLPHIRLLGHSVHNPLAHIAA